MVKNYGGVPIIGGHHTAKNWGCPDTVDTNRLTPASKRNFVVPGAEITEINAVGMAVVGIAACAYYQHGHTQDFFFRGVQ